MVARCRALLVALGKEGRGTSPLLRICPEIRLHLCPSPERQYVCLLPVSIVLFCLPFSETSLAVSDEKPLPPPNCLFYVTGTRFFMIGDPEPWLTTPFDFLVVSFVKAHLGSPPSLSLSWLRGQS